jgi:hypothetical protein
VLFFDFCGAPAGPQAILEPLQFLYLFPHA